MNTGRGLMKRMTLKKLKRGSSSPNSGRRSPVVSSCTAQPNKRINYSGINYRPFVTHIKSASRSRSRRNSIRQGMNTNMFKNIIVKQRNRIKAMKKPLGIKI
jgi:hypothetical protein